jgi:hypothetical protein
MKANRRTVFYLRSLRDNIVTYLGVTKELVSGDTKSVIISAATCASSWVSEKQASRVSLLDRSEGRRSRRSEGTLRRTSLPHRSREEGAADRKELSGERVYHTDQGKKEPQIGRNSPENESATQIRGRSTEIAAQDAGVARTAVE